MCSQWPGVNVLYNTSSPSTPSLWILHLICSKAKREALEVGWCLRYSFWGYIMGGKERKCTLQSTLVPLLGLPAQPRSAFLLFTSCLHSPQGELCPYPVKSMKWLSQAEGLSPKHSGKVNHIKKHRAEGRGKTRWSEIQSKLPVFLGECSHGL